MNFLLDTNICSEAIKRPGRLVHRFIQYTGRLAIPNIVLAEITDWSRHKEGPSDRLIQIRGLLAEVEVIDFNSVCAGVFGRLRPLLVQLGVIVALMDLLIASVALAHDLTLVTHNTADFELIPGLRLED